MTPDFIIAVLAPSGAINKKRRSPDADEAAMVLIIFQ